jgi:hypothetical protein
MLHQIVLLALLAITALWEQMFRMVTYVHLARIVPVVLICQFNVLLASII